MSYDPNNPPAYVVIFCAFALFGAICGMCYAAFLDRQADREARAADAVATVLEAEFNATAKEAHNAIR